jgi:uncharacterized protein YndB with AHSA1/START domain
VTTVRFNVRLPYRVDLVWRAIADRRLLAEWFVPTDMETTPGATFHAYPPSGLPGFPVFLKIEVLAVQAFHRLEMRWSGTSTHSVVGWTLHEVDGETDIHVEQTGYLGLSGEERAAELDQAYRLMFGERLPQVLARIKQPAPAPPAAPAPPRRVSLRRKAWLPAERRTQLLSLGAAMVITVLVATALAVFLLRDPYLPADASPPPRSPQSAVQSGLSPEPQPIRTSAVPKPLAAVKPLKATFAVTKSYEGGYIGSITITAEKSEVDGWSAVLELPVSADVTSAWDRIQFARNGNRVTFTPQEVHRVIPAGESFTFSFQVGGDGRPVGCQVNGVACLKPA